MCIPLEREVEKLKKMVLFLCAMVEENVRKAVRSLETQDRELANLVINNDREIDEKEVRIEEQALTILATQQPVAYDLRFIVAVLKINSDLERIGDLAVNIAEQTLRLETGRPLPANLPFAEMAEKVEAMLRQSLDALVNLDAEMARAVCAADAEVDALHRFVYDLVQEALRRDPSNCDPCIQALSVSRQLERIADHATNMAEDVIYMREGEIVRHQDGELRFASILEFEDTGDAEPAREPQPSL
jgi:phosphate transport system protein